MNSETPRTSDARRLLKRMTRRVRETEARFACAEVNATIAELISEARKAAGLTQSELAERVGTRQPVIARLEDAHYTGHSLSMLQRIATALDLRLQIKLSAAKGRLGA